MKVVIIPDVHGRSFWKKAIPEIENGTEVVFLGDYLDSYLFEGITPNMVLANFKEILSIAKTYDNIHLLIGNHDCTYIEPEARICECRTDYDHLSEIHQLFKDNIELFSLYHYVDDKLLLSHAGVHPEWLERVKNRYNRKTDDIRILLDRVMNGLIIGEKSAYALLGIVSHWRGGWSNVGSVVWADIHEFKDKGDIGIRQIVGHTLQLNKEKTDGGFNWVDGSPVTFNNVTCIDTRKCYVWEDGDLKEL